MAGMADCPYGKASLVFPLAVPAGAALGLVAATEGCPAVRADVIGHSTPLTIEAGACSVRLSLQPPPAAADVPAGNYAVAIRSDRFGGWLPGLANTKHVEGDLLLEVVVLARPDRRLTSAMYLPTETLCALWPVAPGGAEVRFLKPLLLKQLSDCPGQWLRDRLLKLADMIETRFGGQEEPGSHGAALLAALEAAGLRPVEAPADAPAVGPADRGQRVDDQELGYWKEEMDHGHWCAGSMEGSQRLDVPDDIIAAML